MSASTTDFRLAPFMTADSKKELYLTEDRQHRPVILFYPWVVAVTVRRASDGSVSLTVDFICRPGVTQGTHRIDFQGHPVIELRVRHGRSLDSSPERGVLRLELVSETGAFSEEYWERVRQCLARPDNLGDGFGSLVDLMGMAARKLVPGLSNARPATTGYYACEDPATLYEAMARLFQYAAQDLRYRGRTSFDVRAFYRDWLEWWTCPTSQPRHYREGAENLPDFVTTNREALESLLRPPAA
jgi:hypothetical protein